MPPNESNDNGETPKFILEVIETDGSVSLDSAGPKSAPPKAEVSRNPPGANPPKTNPPSNKR